MLALQDDTTEHKGSLDLTAVVCTHNRRLLLEKAVSSLLRQDLSRGRYEVLIVDNGSSDTTRQYGEQISLDEPNVRYVFEPRVGLSFARNTGLKDATGKYVCYLDDDAEAEPEWLSTILRVFNDSSLDGDVGIACGPVIPNWETPPPTWLKPKYWGALSVVNISDSPHFLNNQTWYPEGNSAYQRSILRAVGGFDTQLGRSGKNLAANEGATVDLKIRDLGYGIYYVPEMRIHHFIPKHRASKQWLLRREYWQGYSYAMLDLMQRPLSMPKVFLLMTGRALGAFTECLKTARRLLDAVLFKSAQRDEDLFDQLLRVAMETGYCWGVLEVISKKMFFLATQDRD